MYEYIGLNSPLYVKRMIEKIIRRSEDIATYPLSDRKVSEYDATRP